MTGPWAADERAALAGFLDRQRDALVRKVRGVGEADAQRAPTASALTLLGLLKHAAVWEARWFQGVVAGRPLADGWPERQPPTRDDDFRLEPEDTVELWIGRFEAAARVSREIVAGLDLDAPCARPDIFDGNVRAVVLHLIEETARHCGHADILRETIDGSRGL